MTHLSGTVHEAFGRWITHGRSQGKRVFNLIDKDKSGCLSLKELVLAVQLFICEEPKSEESDAHSPPVSVKKTGKVNSLAIAKSFSRFLNVIETTGGHDDDDSGRKKAHAS